MAQYNLIRNASFQALTSSGTGNKALEWLQLSYLIDGSLTSSGVSLVPSDQLWLEVDLSQRIKIDEIRLYASGTGYIDATKFYYKNSPTDSYSLIPTYSGSGYCYATVSGVSAPRCILATISGVTTKLDEFLIYNDDYIVAFGEDGSQYSEYLTDTPIGEVGGVQAVKIFNNDTAVMPVNAYMTVDYTGTESDKWLEISNNPSGPFYSLDDGVLVEDDSASSDYIWSMGSFSNVAVTGQYVAPTVSNMVNVGAIPLITNSYSFYCGTNCAVYDRSDGYIYALGLDSGTYKMFRFDKNYNIWYLLGEVLASGVQGGASVMSVCNVGATKRAYIYTKYCDGNEFGYYNITTGGNNWTACSGTTFSGSIGTDDRMGMTSDGSNYVYVMLLHRAYAEYGKKTFKRFNISTGLWESLSLSYTTGDNATPQGGETITVCLTYDWNRDYIYAVVFHRGRSTPGYLQRYIPSTDSWNSTYVQIQSLTTLIGCGSKATTEHSIAYYDNRVFFTPNNETSPDGSTFYGFNYDVVSGTVSSTNLSSYRMYDAGSAEGWPFCVTPPSRGSSYPIQFFCNTQSNRDRLIAFKPQREGYYISPIFELEDKYNSSFFVIDGDTASGIASFSINPDMYNATIKVRSSDVAPIPNISAYWVYSNNAYVYKWIPYDDTSTSFFTGAGVGYGSNNHATAVCQKTGNVALSENYWYGFYGAASYIVNSAGTKIGEFTSGNWNSSITTLLSFDANGNLWHYSGYVAPQGTYSNAPVLRHFTTSFGEISNKTGSGMDFCYAGEAELNGDGVWYCDSTSNTVMHLNYACATIASIVLPKPRSLCGTSDNGCWTIDNTDLYARRYDYYGNLVNQIYLGKTAVRMCHDYADGFWYINGNYVYHVTENGVEDLVSYILGPTALSPTHDGCVVLRQNYTAQYNVYFYFIDYAQGTITRSRYLAYQGQYQLLMGARSINASAAIKHHTAYTIFPAPYDPVWGDAGSLAWKEVAKDGYMLPKVKFHQAYIKFWGSPKLQKIIMSPAVRIEDIYPQTSVEAYVRTNIPFDADVATYESRLKVWWGVE